MSDFAGNIARWRFANQLIDTLPNNPRALSADEAKILASEANKYRHLAAHFDAQARESKTIPYVEREIRLQPDAPCPLCGQNVHVEIKS